MCSLFIVILVFLHFEQIFILTIQSDGYLFQEKEIIQYQTELLKNKILRQLKLSNRPPKLPRSNEVMPFIPYEFSLKEDDTVSQGFLWARVHSPYIVFDIPQQMCKEKQVSHPRVHVYLDVDETEEPLKNHASYSLIYKESLVAQTFRKGRKLIFEVNNKVKLCPPRRLKFKVNSSNKVQKFSISRQRNYLPSLIVETIEHNTHRERRTKDSCTAIDCCLRSFYFNFTEVGWQDFFYVPEGFQANYCAGGCFSKRDLVKAGRERCCVAKEKKGIYLIYKKDGYLKRSYFENLKVTTCGCTEN